MADNISYFRTTARPQPRFGGGSGSLSRPRRRRGPVFGLVTVLVLGLCALAAGVIALVSSNPGLDGSGAGLASVGMPLGGGKIQHVTVNTGNNTPPIPVEVRGNEIWPLTTLRAGESLSVQVVIKRPGWVSWLTGSTVRITRTIVTPTAHLSSRFLTLNRGSTLRVAFDTPVRAIAYSTQGPMTRKALSAPQSSVALPRTSAAGSILVAGIPKTWERAQAQMVSWFPAGLARASVVSNPAPGARLGPEQRIVLTFSKPVASVLGRTKPALTPATPGTWHVLSSHAIAFQPSGYGYGLGASVRIGLPGGLDVVGGAGSSATWSVPGGTTMRLHQLLAGLGYLPVNFQYAGTPPANTPAAQIQAAANPPKGSFSWRYGNTPAQLRADWSPTASGVVTRGAIMAFQNNEGMDPTGVASPAVWQALIKATIAGQRNTFGYTFVSVSEGSPETEHTWHNGRVVESGLVNTGIGAAPTATGTYPVFEHLRVTTMTGTNPDGTPYSDPGIPWVSYFNGGDALHGFIRASYGFPQSLGCVEMPYSEAAAVWPYTPIGTLVDVQ